MRWQRILPPVAALVVWQALSASGIVSAVKLPSPLQVAGGLADLIRSGMPPGHRLHLHVAYSLERVLWGYALAVAVAVPLGIAVGWSRRLAACVEPLVEILRPVPPLAWIPIAILWFGIGIRSAAFIIFLGAFFP